MARSGDDNKPSMFNVLFKPEVRVPVPEKFEMPPVKGGMVSLGKRRVELMGGGEEVEPMGSKRHWSMMEWRMTIGGGNGREVVHHKTFEAIAALAGMGDRMPRQLRMKEHDGMWWEKVRRQCYPVDDFKCMYRMSRATFEMLCRELAATIVKEDTPRCKAIPVDKRIAVCIWRLASAEPLRQISKRFGLGISTCHNISFEVCAAIKDLLMPKFLVWPNGPSAAVVANQFEVVCGIPNIIGAIYNTHIPIIAPTVNTTDYEKNPHMKKPSYSIKMQAVVDAGGSFTNICIGYPGSMSDEDVLLLSSLKQELGETGLIQAQGKWLLGGSTYPVTDWMLAPYTNTNLSWVQRLFNEKVTSACEVAKDAIMRFKARWKILQKRSDINLEDFPVMVSACCVLHNICERSGDTLDPQLAFDHVDDDILAEKPMHYDATLVVRDNIANNLIVRGKSVRVFNFL